MFLGVEAQLTVHLPEDVALLSETEMLPSLPEIKLPHTEKSLVLAEVRRIFTTCQRSCEKLMLSVVSMCLQGGGFQWYITLQHIPRPGHAPPPPRSPRHGPHCTCTPGRLDMDPHSRGAPTPGTSLYMELRLFDIFKPFHYKPGRLSCTFYNLSQN